MQDLLTTGAARACSSSAHVTINCESRCDEIEVLLSGCYICGSVCKGVDMLVRAYELATCLQDASAEDAPGQEECLLPCQEGRSRYHNPCATCAYKCQLTMKVYSETPASWAGI